MNRSLAVALRRTEVDELVGSAIAVLALLFTVATFWWQNWRRGSLHVTEPHAFAMVSDSTLALVRLPVALYNTGARTILVQNLRLWLPGQNDIEALPWRTTRRTLRPGKDDVEDFPAPFAVQGRDAVVRFLEFGHPLPGFVIQRGPQPARLEALLGHRRGWVTVLEFVLLVPDQPTVDLSSYLAHDNTPIEWRFSRQALDRRFRRLLEDLQAAKPEPDSPEG